MSKCAEIWYRVNVRGQRVGEIKAVEVVKETPKTLITVGLLYDDRQFRQDKKSMYEEYFNTKEEAVWTALEVLGREKTNLENQLHRVNALMVDLL